jgi:hypothetical protein
VFGEQLTGLGDGLADRVRVDPQQVGQHVLGADLAQVDDGDHDPVGVGEQTPTAGAGRPAAASAALLVAALRGLSGLVGSQQVGEPGELV